MPADDNLTIENTIKVFDLGGENMRLMTKEKVKGIEVFAVMWITAAVLTNVMVNLKSVNFWVDEAMLAYSVVNRSLGTLTATPLDWNQSAPFLYIYIVKFISIIAGKGEFSLRLCSLVSYCLLLFFYYYLACNTYLHRHPLFETAFLASVPFLMNYSHEFKPYMTEGCSVLGVLILYYLHVEKKWNWYLFIVISSAMILIGNPVCFLLGGILCYEFLSGIREKNKNIIIQSISGSVIVFVVFIAYYFFWLSPVINDGYMVDFWEDYKFEFTGMKALIADFQLLANIMRVFGNIWVIMLAGIIGCVIINFVHEKNRYISIIVYSLVITFFASSIGMFPVKNRLYLFAYPLFTLLFFHLFNRLWDKGRIENGILYTCAILLLFSQGGIWYYQKDENLIIAREEIRNSICYVKDNIKEDEKCYVYWHALPAFWYENGYENTSIGAYEDNLIFGNGFFYNGENQADIDEILAADKVYILISHINSSGDRVNPMLVQINDNGNLEKIMDNYNTPLYYYTRDISDRKFSAIMEIIESATTGDICDSIVRITNTGEACLNNGFETITLRTKEDSGQELLIPVNDELPIGASMEIRVHFKWNVGVDQLELYLKREGKNWPDEEEIVSVTIYRE